METITARSVVTEDTREIVEGITVLTDYHMNDGYDWMDLINEHGWYAVSSWGEDGWDLGEWPLVVVAATSTADRSGNVYGLAVYVEGDVTCTFYRTQEAQRAEITRHAHYWWMNRRAVDRPEGLTENIEDLPEKFKVPCTGLFS